MFMRQWLPVWLWLPLKRLATRHASMVVALATPSHTLATSHSPGAGCHAGCGKAGQGVRPNPPGTSQPPASNPQRSVGSPTRRSDGSSARNDSTCPREWSPAMRRYSKTPQKQATACQSIRRDTSALLQREAT